MGKGDKHKNLNLNDLRSTVDSGHVNQRGRTRGNEDKHRKGEQS